MHVRSYGTTYAGTVTTAAGAAGALTMTMGDLAAFGMPTLSLDSTSTVTATSTARLSTLTVHGLRPDGAPGCRPATATGTIVRRDQKRGHDGVRGGVATGSALVPADTSCLTASVPASGDVVRDGTRHARTRRHGHRGSVTLAIGNWLGPRGELRPSPDDVPAHGYLRRAPSEATGSALSSVPRGADPRLHLQADLRRHVHLDSRWDPRHRPPGRGDGGRDVPDQRDLDLDMGSHSAGLVEMRPARCRPRPSVARRRRSRSRSPTARCRPAVLRGRRRDAEGPDVAGPPTSRSAPCTGDFVTTPLRHRAGPSRAPLTPSRTRHVGSRSVEAAPAGPLKYACAYAGLTFPAYIDTTATLPPSVKEDAALNPPSRHDDLGDVAVRSGRPARRKHSTPTTRTAPAVLTTSTSGTAAAVPGLHRRRRSRRAVRWSGRRLGPTARSTRHRRRQVELEVGNLALTVMTKTTSPADYIKRRRRLHAAARSGHQPRHRHDRGRPGRHRDGRGQGDRRQEGRPEADRPP